MATLRHLIELLVNPFFLVFVVLLGCTVVVWRKPHALFLRIGLLGALLVLSIISTGWLPCYLTQTLEHHYPVVTKADKTIPWVVVLSGGQAQVDNLPANDLLYAASIKRLVEGVRLLNQLPKAKLLLSGGAYDNEPAEATHLQQLAFWFAIPQQRIVLEGRSINTADQAREVKAIVGENPFYLVTSAIHMPRSMALFQQAGLHPIAAPTDFTLFWYDERWAKRIVPNTYNLFYFTIAMHEVLGQAWAKAVLKV